MLLTRKWPLKALPLHSRRPGYLLGFHLCEAPAMSFELILPFLRPIERLLLDDSISEIMGNPDPLGGASATARCTTKMPFRSMLPSC